jgi:hypothetical protein
MFLITDLENPIWVHYDGCRNCENDDVEAEPPDDFLFVWDTEEFIGCIGCYGQIRSMEMSLQAGLLHTCDNKKCCVSSFSRDMGKLEDVWIRKFDGFPRVKFEAHECNDGVLFSWNSKEL